MITLLRTSHPLIHCFWWMFLAVSPLTAATYLESVGGDLSNEPGAPTFINLDLGNNIITGSVTSPVDTRDFFSFTLQPGQGLSGIFLLSYLDGTTGLAANTGFIHLDDGLTSILPVSGTALLGGNTLNRTNYPLATTNVLTNLATAPLAGRGFTAPLVPGDYTINVQQTGSQLNHYSLSLVVVPEPSAASLVILAVVVGSSMRLRK